MEKLNYDDEIYPALLREIHNPPPLLYYRGNINRLNEPCLAVVGSRKPTSYGESITKHLVRELVEAGLVIVSGLAYGIDGIAHRSALEAVLGRTIAVLGCGLDDASIYPRANLRLALEIIKSGGLLLSEHPPGTAALKHHFILRNRIIAGLSHGVLVPECAAKSGALITVRYAVEENRTIFAVPGQAQSTMSAGPHWLLKQGAQLVTEAGDVLSDFGIELPQYDGNKIPAGNLGLTGEQQTVLRCLQNARPGGPTISLTIDAISRQTLLNVSNVTVALTMLEMRGLIQNNPDGAYKFLT